MFWQKYFPEYFHLFLGNSPQHACQKPINACVLQSEMNYGIVMHKFWNPETLQMGTKEKISSKVICVVPEIFSLYSRMIPNSLLYIPEWYQASSLCLSGCTSNLWTQNARNRRQVPHFWRKCEKIPTNGSMLKLLKFYPLLILTTMSMLFYE